MPGRHYRRIILHLDMDAFYAAVEIRENPALAGKPLIIGLRGRRGVVSTCSYEARRFGVRSAMPSLTAERLCPEAIWLPGRMALYVEVSRRIRAMMDDVTPLVEPLSIDEAFLDLTGIAASLEEGKESARRLKERIRRKERLSASVGIAPNKFLAKIASDLEKPDGLVVLRLEDVATRLHPLPVERLWGVGPKTAGRLHAAGIVTVADVTRVPKQGLEQAVGATLAQHVLRLAHGEDDREVTSDREAKSISEERTYAEDIKDFDAIDRMLLERSEGVARELRRQQLTARTIHLKIRTGDFKTWTRSKTLKVGTDLPEVILAAVRELFARRIRLRGKGVRLLGVGVSSFKGAEDGQPSLFPDAVDEKAHRLAAAADALRDRFGENAVTRARLLRKRKGKDDRTPPEASSLPSVD